MNYPLTTIVQLGFTILLALFLGYGIVHRVAVSFDLKYI